MADIKQTNRQKNYKKLKDSTPEDMPVPAAKLRFPVIPNDIEYLDCIKNRQTLITFKGEIAGLTWRQVNEKLFTEGIPAGKYAYGMKFKSNPNIYRGFIKSVNPTGERVNDNTELFKIQKNIDSLRDSLSKASSSQLNVDYILAATEKSHAAEISVYKLEIANLKEKILELKAEISQMDKELDQYEKIVKEIKDTGSKSKLEEMIVGFISQLNKPNPELIRKDK
jgi:hypothetical protein